MIKLPNYCSCSELSVFPKNWKSKNARITINWYIKYRYYDPRLVQPRQVVLKGMNQFKNLVERQDATVIQSQDYTNTPDYYLKFMSISAETCSSVKIMS